MKILVLGGTGAMGVHLVELLAVNNDLIVTSRSNRVSKNDRVKYIKGDAQDIEFMNILLKEHFDVIVDFMIYSTKQFNLRYERLLSACNQYIYISSCRVFAQSDGLINEESKLLIDTCSDKNYLLTDEYALLKGRQEKILLGSQKNNWVIIRPYVTYGEERLQLGVYEKEQWLFRALNGKPIVFSKDIADKYTTLTYGRDVSSIMAKIIGDFQRNGNSYNIVCDEQIKWGEVVEIYKKCIERKVEKKVDILIVDSLEETKIKYNPAQLKYDRIYNRVFDNSKLDQVVETKYEFLKVNSGIEKCINSFIENGSNFKFIDWYNEGKLDKICNVKTKLIGIPGIRSKLKYIKSRYF